MAEKKFEYLRYLSLITQVGLIMIISIFLGIFLGIKIDSFFNASPIFMIIFFIIGVTSGFVGVYKIVCRQSNNGPGK